MAKKDNTQKPQKPRWIYRLDSYERAFLKLREAIEISQNRELTQLEKEGTIRRFKYTWESAWKALKDYCVKEGMSFSAITPVSTIREAFAANIIQNGEAWMKMLDDRNKVSHSYDFKEFEKTVEAIKQTHLGLLNELYDFLLEEKSRIRAR